MVRKMTPRDEAMQPYIQGLIFFGFVASIVVAMVSSSHGKQSSDEKPSWSQEVAEQAMKDECALHCTAHGVSEALLIGPRLDFMYVFKGRESYRYSWRSAKPLVKITIAIVKTQNDQPPQVERLWAIAK